MRRVGIMGGTFNPIHNGHLLIAENAYEQLQLDEVLFIPTGRAPHKQGMDILDGKLRLRMVELAIANNPAFLADARELRSKELSYSAVTLTRMKQKSPDWELYFIMGGDSLRDFTTWYQPQVICACATLVVAVRDDCDRTMLLQYKDDLKAKFDARIYLLDTPNMSVTSSELRKRVAMGRSIRYQVPDAVRDFILENQLYHEGTDTGITKKDEKKAR